MPKVAALPPKGAQPRRPLHPNENKIPACCSRYLSKLCSDGERNIDFSKENEDITYALLNQKYSHLFKENALKQRDSLARRSTILTCPECGAEVPLTPIASQPEKKEVHNPLANKSLLVGLLVTLAVLVMVNFPSDSKVQPLVTDLRKDIQSIERKFPSQAKEMWPGIVSGINSVLLSNSTVPSMFLLLHNENEATSSCLAHHVAQVASGLMNTSQREPLVLEGEELAANALYLEDRGLFIEHYKPLVEAHRIMVLNNVQSVPADLARSLHIFCDAVTPLVGRAIYIFTLNAHEPWQDSDIKMAERGLNAAWKQLHADIRQPLIVRVTSGLVVRVKPEGETHVCY